ncbi:MAG: TadE/TadG family type IV pilus assembly protein, partial [Polyangiaceae bacterium]
VALPEFAVVILPLCCLFFGLAQICHLFVGHLMFRHAAHAAARMAIVGASPMQPGAFVGDYEEPRKAALEALGYWTEIPNPRIDDVQVKTTYPETDQYGPVQVKLTGTFHCIVPLGQKLICKNGVVKMTSQITLPHQGARYAQE